jgi:hypothetical protein
VPRRFLPIIRQALLKEKIKENKKRKKYSKPERSDF